MNDDSILWFGKHKGVRLTNVPASYLLWLREQMEETPPQDGMRIELKKYLDDNLEVLRMERNRRT